MWKEATETVHGQHQAVDKNDNITVCTSCRRPQSLQGNQNRQPSDGGQRSNVIRRKEAETMVRAERGLMNKSMDDVHQPLCFKARQNNSEASFFQRA